MIRKRFTIICKPENTYSKFWIARENWEKKLNPNDVVDLLNELHEENEQLKIFLEALNEELSLANRDNDTLEEENEQLKQAYNDAKKNVEKKEQILKEIMEDNLLIQDISKELSK